MTIQGDEVVETPIDLFSLSGIQNEISFTNTEFSSGFVGVDGAVATNNFVGFDDIKITSVPEPKYYSFMFASISLLLVVRLRKGKAGERAIR